MTYDRTEFDRIITASYHSNGDGTWSGEPCKVCGSQSFDLDPTPSCIPCSLVLQEVRDKAEAFAQAMDAVGELVQVARGPAKEELHLLSLLWLVTLQRWSLATRTADG